MVLEFQKRKNRLRNHPFPKRIRKRSKYTEKYRFWSATLAVQVKIRFWGASCSMQASWSHWLISHLGGFQALQFYPIVWVCVYNIWLTDLRLKAETFDKVQPFLCTALSVRLPVKYRAVTLGIRWDHCLFKCHLELIWYPLQSYLAPQGEKIYQYWKPCNSLTHNLNFLYRPDCFFLHDVDHIPGSKRVGEKFLVINQSAGFDINCWISLVILFCMVKYSQITENTWVAKG